MGWRGLSRPSRWSERAVMSVPALQAICCFSAAIPACHGDAGPQALEVISLSHGETVCPALQTLASAAHGERHVPAWPHSPRGPVKQELLVFPHKDPIITRQGVERRNKSDYTKTKG